MDDRSETPLALDTDWLKAQRRPIGVIAASNVAIMLVGCLFLFQFWRMGAMLIFWCLLAALAVVAANLVFLYRTQRIKISGYISSLVLYAVLVVVAAASGGFYDPSFSWLYVVPLAAAFLVDLTALFVFLGLVLATTVVFWWLPPELLPTLVPAEMHPAHSLLIRVTALLSLGTMTAFFVRSQYLALRLLKGANQALQEEVEAHHRTTEALAESEAEFRDLVENSADMIWTHDLSGNILSANEPFGRLLGVEPDEVLGRGGDRYVAGESREDWDGYLRAIASEGTYRGMMTLINAEGEPRVLEFNNTLRDDGDSPVVRAHSRDVSEQVASQRALQSRVDQEQLMLAISTRFIDAGAEELVTAIDLALGEIGVFLACDRLNFFLLGAREQVFERYASWARDEGPEGTSEVPHSVAIPWLHPRLEQFETLSVASVADLESEARTDLAALLGADVVSATIVPVFGREGLMGLLTLESVTAEREWRREHQALAHIAGMVFGNAITRVRDERRTLSLQDEVQKARKMESLGLIAGGIAHDFNNLLMVVLGNASLAMSQVPEGSGAEEALQAIDSSARRAATLTAQMLAYAGGANLDRRPVALEEVVQQELEQMRAGSTPDIRLETSFARDVPEVFADSGLVRQLLRALLDNSFEAMSEGGGVVRVELRSIRLESSSPVRGYRPLQRGASPGAYGVLEVRDSGPGIEPGALEKIFDPFFSTKFAGRGLGLAAALGVVRGHEGVIEVESDSNGTCFRVFIPAVKKESEPRSAGPPAPEALPLASEPSLPAILVVDPNPEVLAVLDGLLTSGGFDPVTTPHARRALEQLGGNGSRFRAVVAELRTVEASDALLAARWRTENIPWILSSDERKEDISERLAYAGASAFLSKPFEGRKLLSLLDRLLREYGSARAAL